MPAWSRQYVENSTYRSSSLRRWGGTRTASSVHLSRIQKITSICIVCLLPRLSTPSDGVGTHSRFLTKRVTEKEGTPRAETEEDREKKAKELDEFNKMDAAKWRDTDPESPQESVANTPAQPANTRRDASREKKKQLKKKPKEKKQPESERTKRKQQSIVYSYAWDFMGFCTLWRSGPRTNRPPSQNTNGAAVDPAVVPAGGPAVDQPGGQVDRVVTNVLLCFDLPRDLKQKLIAVVAEKRRCLATQLHDPFCLLTIANAVVIGRFNQSLWTFQTPVRNVEKVSWSETCALVLSLFLFLSNHHRLDSKAGTPIHRAKTVTMRATTKIMSRLWYSDTITCMSSTAMCIT